MKPLVIDWEAFRSSFASEKPLAATIGAFDGLHLGHRELIGRVVSKAGPMLPAVFTFEANPKRLLRPESYEGDLLSLERKLELIGSYGVEVVILIDFSGDFSKMPGRNFLSTVVERGRVAYMAIGWDFHCGRGRDTDARGLQAFCAALAVDVELLDAVSFHGDAASSTRIRRAVKAGRLVEAERLLGRPFELELGDFLGGEGETWRFAAREGMVLPPAGIWSVAGREGEATVLVGPGGLEVRGMGRSDLDRRIPITVLGKNEAIDKE